MHLILRGSNDRANESSFTISMFGFRIVEYLSTDTINEWRSKRNINKIPTRYSAVDFKFGGIHTIGSFSVDHPALIFPAPLSITRVGIFSDSQAISNVDWQIQVQSVSSIIFPCETICINGQQLSTVKLLPRDNSIFLNRSLATISLHASM